MRIFVIKVYSPEKEVDISHSRFGLKADEDDVAKNAPNEPDHEEVTGMKTSNNIPRISAVTLLGLSDYDISYKTHNASEILCN